MPPERFSAPKVGLARIEELGEAWRLAVEAVARARWEAFRTRLRERHNDKLWPSFDAALVNDESGEGAEYRASFMYEAQCDLLAAAHAATERPHAV